jgi:hypothetical protein
MIAWRRRPSGLSSSYADVVHAEVGACAVVIRFTAVVALASALGGCAAPARHPVAVPRDPHSVAALLKIATVFNNDYDNGVYGPVYDRWDARSKAIIARADYVQRHRDCPSGPVTARVESARRGHGGAWLVSYAIGGVQLTDYWFYSDGRWQFDLPLSNPGSVRLYRLSARQYVKALGCAH